MQRALATALIGLGAGGALAAPDATISIDASAPVNVVGDAYISFNLDPSCNRGFHQTNYSNPSLTAAAYYLQPARLRFGGSGADSLVYSFAPGAPDCAAVPSPPPPLAPGCDYVTPGCLNASQAAALFDLAAAANAPLVFGIAFNQSAALAGAPWDSANAARLLAWLAATRRTVYAWELGNEVNNGGGGAKVAAQQAAAFVALAGLVAASSAPAARLVGPDTGAVSPEPFIGAFLAAAPRGLVSAVTHHVYLGLSRSNLATPAALAAKLDSALPELRAFVANVAANASGAEPWAGEMGPIGGGDDGSCGAASVCGTFASALYYADDAALRAAHGYAQHNRQDLFGGHYGLVNSVSGAMALGAADALVVTPDYWVAWLWKRTLGGSVFAANSSAPSVRAYAFRGSPPSPFAARAQCGAAAAQLLLLNLAGAPAAVALPPAAASFSAWALAPRGGDAFATEAELNGAPLPTVLDAATTDPAPALGFIGVPPVSGAAAAGLTLPGWAVAFVCLH